MTLGVILYHRLDQPSLFKNWIIEYPNVSIIAMSGGGKNSPDGYLNMAKLFGAQATFEKPINKEEFLNAVKKALESK